MRELERARERERARYTDLYKIYLNSILKNLNSLFHPIESVFFIHIKVREGESGHLNMNA